MFTVFVAGRAEKYPSSPPRYKLLRSDRHRQHATVLTTVEDVAYTVSHCLIVCQGRVGDAYREECEVLYGCVDRRGATRVSSSTSIDTLVHVSLVREVDVCPVLFLSGLCVEIAGRSVELRDDVGLIEEEGQPRQQRIQRLSRRPHVLQDIGTDRTGLAIQPFP